MSGVEAQPPPPHTTAPAPRSSAPTAQQPIAGYAVAAASGELTGDRATADEKCCNCSRSAGVIGGSLVLRGGQGGGEYDESDSQASDDGNGSWAVAETAAAAADGKRSPMDEDAVLYGTERPRDGPPRRGRRRRRDGYLSMTASSVASVVWSRTSVLVSLLLLQSLSQFILEMYETLISEHVIIPLFLTMLVGAGGNAGNQATVRAITGLASGEFRQHDFLRLLRKEFLVGLVSATVLAVIAYGRVYYFYGSDNLLWSTIAITLSLFFIVLSSAVIGTTLPFLLQAVGLNREHAAPIIQVVMDITGVFLTCAICSAMIPESEHRTHK